MFDEQAEQAVAAVAGHAGVALENARLHRELEENSLKFSQLANSISQLAWMARPDGSVYWYNERWYQYTGTTAQQMQGWGWQTVHDPAVLPQVMSACVGRLRLYSASWSHSDANAPSAGDQR